MHGGDLYRAPNSEALDLMPYYDNQGRWFRYDVYVLMNHEHELCVYDKVRPQCC